MEANITAGCKCAWENTPRSLLFHGNPRKTMTLHSWPTPRTELRWLGGTLQWVTQTVLQTQRDDLTSGLPVEVKRRPLESIGKTMSEYFYSEDTKQLKMKWYQWFVLQGLLAVDIWVDILYYHTGQSKCPLQLYHHGETFESSCYTEDLPGNKHNAWQ